jgi:uncharacterized protein (DUF1501 family)
MKRREFLKLSAAMGASAFAPITLFGGGFSDYKALVVILLHGGNDSLNMFIPTTDDSKKGYSAYAKARGILAIDNNALNLPIANNKLALEGGEKNPYYKNGTITDSYTKGFYETNFGIGVNPLMPELAYLIKSNKVAIVPNMGTLHQPTTKKDIIDKKAILPIHLYSHNSQRALFYTGDSQNQNAIGWAGHLADMWGDINNSSVYGLNLSIDRTSKLQFGKNTNPLVIARGGPSTYRNIKDKERELYNKLLQIDSKNSFKRLYNTLKGKSFTYQDILKQDWKINPTYTSTNGYGEAIFSKMDAQTLGLRSSEIPNGGLSDQLKAVAKLINIGKQKGLSRQIFYVMHGGYDTHGNQKFQHGKNLRTLSMALYDFNLALQELGLDEQVTTFNISDFGRSAGNNGNGSDHAWGGHYFVMGGAVKGGLYGEMPTLKLGGEDDATKKGRLIPTTSQTQYFATILKWFGVNSNEINQLFPELKNFDTKDLGFFT